MTERKTKLFEEEKRLPDIFTQEIGRVFVAFARMEMGFEILFAGLIDQNQFVGRAIWSLFGGFDARLAALLSVYVARYGEEDAYSARLKSIITAANSVALRRNGIIHSAWGVGDDGSFGRLRTLRAKKGFRIDMEDNITPENIHDVAEAIVSVSLKLLALHHELIEKQLVHDYTPLAE